MAKLTALTDFELTGLIRLGDRDAFEELYNRYKGLLYVHAYKKLRNEEEADDAVHDLFATVWAKRAELDINSSVAGYLYSAIRNNILKLFARKQIATNYVAFVQHTGTGEHCVTDHRTRENQLAALIEKEINLLPPKMREVFELSRKNNLSHREIAEQLDLSEQTVKKHVHHALTILRKKLGLFAVLYYLFNS